MNQSSTGAATKLLREISAGESSAAPAELLPLVYNELRRLAQNYLKAERANHTLQATALVHEAYIRLVDWQNVSWQNRAHFLGVAASVMRKILVDYARTRTADKRGGEWQKISLQEAVNSLKQNNLDLIAVNDALEALAKLDWQQSRIVECRFFAGMTIEETSEVLGISPATVKREWTIAKAWLRREISRDYD